MRDTISKSPIGIDLLKYPRTPHLLGSRLQPGDSAVGQIGLDELPAGAQVWEEKLDGSCIGLRFDQNATLLLQSRGHYLLGGGRERQYNLLKAWADRHIDDLFDRIGARYIVYGEWLYAKHTVFYDHLPHYFLEFDIYDTDRQTFLDTDSRHRLLAGSVIHSVPVLHRGRLTRMAEISALIGASLYQTSDWRDVLHRTAERGGIAPQRVLRETDMSGRAEGLYLKVEADGRVAGRYKFVRPDFLQTILDSGTHWAARSILPNQLAPGIDLLS